jgi:hypothetical protein
MRFWEGAIWSWDGSGFTGRGKSWSLVVLGGHGFRSLPCLAEAPSEAEGEVEGCRKITKNWLRALAPEVARMMRTTSQYAAEKLTNACNTVEERRFSAALSPQNQDGL